jgi:hypothetical protein
VVAPRPLAVASVHPLRALGADTFAHANGSLAQHLRNTAQLLDHWGNREAVCLAGLYHAVYGTDGITGALVGLRERGAIAATIGTEAEALAYLYGACARDVFHPRIGTPQQLRFADRFRGSEYAISERSLRDFCEITVANEIELARANERFRHKHRKALAHLFARMQGLVSGPAREAALGVFPE